MRWRRGGAERPPRVGRRQFWRGVLGGVLIVLPVAAATATASLLAIEKANPFRNPVLPHIRTRELSVPKPGHAQTILILGSDHRYTDGKNGAARSDTIILVRLDPHQPATTLLSLPRDLEVEIPGYGINKINAAYALGGPDLTLKTVKLLTGLAINHVVNVQFSGFERAVDALGCVYVDVDRRYFHSNKGIPALPGLRWAAINVEPGYQRLCGNDALAYVRFRHTDSDFVRGARQQGFMRAMKDQVSKSQLFGDRSALLHIFGRNTQTDAALGSTPHLISLLKLALFSAGHPVRQMEFAPLSLSATPQTIAPTVHDFLSPPSDHAAPPSAGAPSSSSSSSSALTGHGHEHLTRPERLGELQMADVTAASAALLATLPAGSPLGFPLYYPTSAPRSAQFSLDPDDEAIRAYTLRDRADRPHRAYRIVGTLSEAAGQYFGVQGTDWRTPPLLQAKHTSRTVHGRRLALYRDGSRLQAVAWRTPSAVYWVSNTLSRKLTNAQMLEIASTLVPRRFP